MAIKALPRNPNLEQYRKQAKELVRGWSSGERSAITRVTEFHPRFRGLRETGGLRLSLADAQLVLAREHGSPSWTKFTRQIEALNRERLAPVAADQLAEFIRAACVPLDGNHGSGTLLAAEAILAEHPEVAGSSLYAAAILGDAAGVRRHLAETPASATGKGGPHGWDALTCLCFSKYLRLARDRSDQFVRAAEALLDGGADARTGWYEKGSEPHPIWESAIYGAAGIARHPGLTRLLLERGADPNDEETPYHVPESYNNEVLTVVLESRRMNADSLATMLLRKADWHDAKGMELLLAAGADPNRTTRWQYTALGQALRRDNDLGNIDLLLDHGADPSIPNGVERRSATVIAAWRGRGDVLASLRRRGVTTELSGIDGLVAAVAQNEEAAARARIIREPRLRTELLEHGGSLLAEFAGNGNVDGLGLLLALGVDVRSLYTEGDGYFEIAKASTALHVAAWRARHRAVRLLVERGAAVEAPDGRGRTALELAVAGVRGLALERPAIARVGRASA